MKGVIFNILEDFIDEKFGEGSFDDLAATSLPNNTDPFVGPGTYPDNYLFSIITKTVERYSLNSETTIREFGCYMFLKLSQKYPNFLEIHDNAKEFIKTLQTVVHVEVRKLFPEAVTPKFLYSGDLDGKLTLRYESERNLFGLVEGLIDGAGEYFKSSIKITRVESNPEENYCVFNLEFSS